MQYNNKHNKATNKIVIEAQIHKTDRERWEMRWDGDGMKGGEKISQRTLMHNSQTQTAIWELAWGGERLELGGGGTRELKWEQL